MWTDVLMDVCLPYLLESSLLVRCDIISRFYEVKSNRMKKAVKRQSYSRSKRKYSCNNKIEIYGNVYDIESRTAAFSVVCDLILRLK